MKKFLLLIPAICLLSIQSVNAQFEKGKIMTGVTSTIGLGEFGTDLMSVGIITRKYDPANGGEGGKQKIFGFNLLPRAGYFVMDNLAVGVDLVLGVNSRKDDDDGDKYTESTLAVGPFARYYYPLEKIYPFAEANIGFGSYAEKYSDSDWDYKEGLLIFGVGVGAAKPIGEKIMLDASVGYGHKSWKDKDDDDRYVYGGIGIRIGFTLFFDKPE